MEKRKKIKVLILSKVFLKGHPREGQPTYFKESIYQMLYPYRLTGSISYEYYSKKHTIRAMSDWPPIINRINKGEMTLSVRQWIGKPYITKQDPPIFELNKVGLQYISIYKKKSDYYCWVRDSLSSMISRSVRIEVLARNDGLSTADFKAWFEPYLKSDGCIDKDTLMWSGVIIYFTDFRY